MGEQKRGTGSKATKKPVKVRTLLEHFAKKPSGSASTCEALREARHTSIELGISTESASTPPNETADVNEMSEATNVPPVSEYSSPIAASIDSDDCNVHELAEHMSNGSSPYDPIVIESSPVKSKITSALPAHPFFSPMQRTAASTSQVTTKTIAEVDPPYPNRDTQHVRGAQSSYPSRRITSLEEIALASPRSHPQSEPRKLNKGAYLCDVPHHHQTHPAILRLSQPSPTDDASSQKLWTDKWRPTRADEVLGNDESARYLRDWLQALQLELLPHEAVSSSSKGKEKAEMKRKRPRITRQASSKRGRKKQRISDDDDSWIVEDDCMSAYEDGQADDELLLGKAQEADDYAPPAPSEPSNFSATFTELSNTIVLSGPPGSGKTASVYACAEELGWEVFEVYPGIGKRNSVNLDNLVGEVGKNHLVSQAPSKEEDTRKARFASFLPGKLPERLEGRASESPTVVNPHSFRQSLILLEEVDILFGEDANFWPAVKNLIKDCRRPVICTCNDISLIPVNELPIQRQLAFTPCESELAISYLQALCATEGRGVPRQELTRLFDVCSTKSADIFDSIDSSTPDLRSAIHTLQFWYSGRSEAWTDELVQPWNDHAESGGESLLLDDAVSPKGSLDRAQTSLFDLLSYSDCHLARSAADTSEAIALSDINESRDDEVGHRILYNRRNTLTQMDFYDHTDRDTVIASTLSRGAHAMSLGTFLRFPVAPRRSRVVDWYLLERLAGAMVTRHRDALAMDYLPHIRQIVAADDIEIAKMMSMVLPGGRRTRNSQVTAYVRSIPVTEEQREALERTALSA